MLPLAAPIFKVAPPATVVPVTTAPSAALLAAWRVPCEMVVLPV
jgi:hypothetical protein